MIPAWENNSDQKEREREKEQGREGASEFLEMKGVRRVRIRTRASTHPACTQIKTLRIPPCISLLLLLLQPPPPPHPIDLPPARAYGFYLSCVQAQASVKRAEKTSPASALSRGWRTHASITCNIELLCPFCVCLIRSGWTTRRETNSSSISAQPFLEPCSRKAWGNLEGKYGESLF